MSKDGIKAHKAVWTALDGAFQRALEQEHMEGEMRSMLKKQDSLYSPTTIKATAMAQTISGSANGPIMQHWLITTASSTHWLLWEMWKSYGRSGHKRS
jgi:hypothetical protein